MLNVQFKTYAHLFGVFYFIGTYIHNDGEERPKLASVFVQLFTCPHVKYLSVSNVGDAFPLNLLTGDFCVMYAASSV